MPNAIIACIPVQDRHGIKISISEDDICSAIREALNEPLLPPDDIEVPNSLLTQQDMDYKWTCCQPHFLSSPSTECAVSTDVVTRTLSNGINVSFKQLAGENRLSVRIVVRGGRWKESLPGSVLLGVRTMEEGGAFLDKTREEVELFCNDNGIFVELNVKEDSLCFDLSGGTLNCETNVCLGNEGLNGAEGALQVAHILFNEFKFEQDAFERAKHTLREQSDSNERTLELLAAECLISSLTANNRLIFPSIEQIDRLSFNDIQEAVISQLNSSKIEVSLVSDMPICKMEQLALKYLGTIPVGLHRAEVVSDGSRSINVYPLGMTRQLSLTLPDDEARALGFIAGSFPNAWGVFADNTTLCQRMKALKSEKLIPEQIHWEHPLFGKVALWIVKDVRMFCWILIYCCECI
jgi:hypothetical protein